MPEEFLVIVAVAVCKRCVRGKERQAPLVRLERRHLERRRFTPHESGHLFADEAEVFTRRQHPLSVLCLPLLESSFIPPSWSVLAAVLHRLLLSLFYLLYSSFSLRASLHRVPISSFSLYLFVLLDSALVWLSVAIRLSLYIFFLRLPLRLSISVADPPVPRPSPCACQLLLYACLDQS